ncbi:prepilin-type N-terminal cleavage/methylation domain-containing protein [bacterium]|nr:prepilin-type N-terminal cleavage/methylation domain-containing protein [bacterium]
MDIKKLNLTFSPAHPLTRSPAHLHTCTGFTLLELLIVLIIIGFLVTATGRTFRKVDKDGPITAALTDMKAIADAIVKGIYPDMGRIPCVGEDPVLTTACLCLGCSEEDQGEIGQAADPINLDELSLVSLECRELIFLLTGEKENIEKTKFIKKTWNKYYSKGWRGPYIEANAMIDATYFDPDLYPPDVEDNHVNLPAITTPWADKCEKMAKEAEKNGDDDLAKQYRKGKYYQILKPVKPVETVNKWEIPKDTACIVCRGPDCLPGDNGNNDVQDYLSCEFSCQERCAGRVEECKEGCTVEYCQGLYPGLSSGHYMIKKCIMECEMECEDLDKCVNDCVSECEKGIKNLAITNPDNDDYIDIGDDMIMFVFSGGVRSPLEK